MTEPDHPAATLPAPAPPAPAWEAAAEALLQRAVALGRRDGLEGPEDRPDWQRATRLPPLAALATPGAAGTTPGTTTPGATTLPPLLLLALRQCYAAGHRHGSDVRREKARRRP